MPMGMFGESRLSTDNDMFGTTLTGRLISTAAFGGPLAPAVTQQVCFQTLGLNGFDPSLHALDERESTMAPTPSQATLHLATSAQQHVRMFE